MTAIRHAVRRLSKNPSFTLIAIFTLALGLGANVAIFSIVDAVLLEPIPLPESERLVVLGHSAPGLDMDEINQSDATYFLYVDQTESFDAISLVDNGTVTLTGLDRPERLEAAFVTPSFFDVIRVPPTLGRTFTAEEGHPDGPEAVVLSEKAWKRFFAGDSSAVGRTLRIDGISREVVGVVPDSIAYPTPDTEIWMPTDLDPNATQLGNFGRPALARLAEGITLERAVTDMNRLTSDLTAAFPENQVAGLLQRAGLAAHAQSLRDNVVDGADTALWMLLGTVAFVLLIACANVANLVLARAESRQRETAIRTALGAGRRHLGLAALSESLVLSLTAGATGLALAMAGVRGLVRFGPQELPRLHEIAVGPKSMAFALLLSLVVGSIFALIPLAKARIRDLATMLKDGGRASTASRQRHFARQTLVAGQVALALMLLVGAGLLVRSFQNLLDVDPGYLATEDALTFTLALPESQYGDADSVYRFQRSLVERLEGLPGVQQASVGSSIPMGGQSSGSGHAIEGQPTDENSLPPIFRREHVVDGYLETLGARLVEGRTFGLADMEADTAVVVVSEGLAEETWPGESAIGKRISPGATPSEERSDPWYTIIGVVADIHSEGLQAEAPKTVYYPTVPKAEGDWNLDNSTDVLIRYQGDRSALMTSVREAIWSIDSNLPVSRVETLPALVESSRARLAFTVVLLLIAAAVALGLGAVGTYGIVSFLVTERTNEIGLRMALGAQQSEVAGMVLRQGLGVAVIGSVLGLIGAFGLTRWLESLLFEVDPLDAATFAAVPVLLLIVVALATLAPALRASRVDPMVALRHE